MTEQPGDRFPLASDPDLQAQTWLSLGEASAFLGIHFTTLRSWADQGEIRVFRTPGGHRRFSVTDLRRFLANRASQSTPSTPDSLMESALVQVRREIQNMAPAATSWHTNLDDAQRQARQERGRRLFALALNFALKPFQRERILADGRLLAAQYGQEAADNGVSLAETGRAVQFFRTQLLQALSSHDSQGKTDDEDLRIRQIIDQFFNEILYAVLDAFESSLRDAYAG